MTVCLTTKPFALSVRVPKEGAEVHSLAFFRYSPGQGQSYLVTGPWLPARLVVPTLQARILICVPGNKQTRISWPCFWDISPTGVQAAFFWLSVIFQCLYWWLWYFPPRKPESNHVSTIFQRYWSPVSYYFYSQNLHICLLSSVIQRDRAGRPQLWAQGSTSTS